MSGAGIAEGGGFSRAASTMGHPNANRDAPKRHGASIRCMRRKRKHHQPKTQRMNNQFERK